MSRQTQKAMCNLQPRIGWYMCTYARRGMVYVNGICVHMPEEGQPEVDRQSWQ